MSMSYGFGVGCAYGACQYAANLVAEYLYPNAESRGKFLINALPVLTILAPDTRPLLQPHLDQNPMALAIGGFAGTMVGDKVAALAHARFCPRSTPGE